MAREQRTGNSDSGISIVGGNSREQLVVQIGSLGGVALNLPELGQGRAQIGGEGLVELSQHRVSGGISHGAMEGNVGVERRNVVAKRQRSTARRQVGTHVHEIMLGAA